MRKFLHQTVNELSFVKAELHELVHEKRGPSPKEKKRVRIAGKEKKEEDEDDDEDDEDNDAANFKPPGKLFANTPALHMGILPRGGQPVVKKPKRKGQKKK